MSEAHVLSNEGHTLIFEKKDDYIEGAYWKVQEMKDSAQEIVHVMTLEGGRLYMDQLRDWGYVGYN